VPILRVTRNSDFFILHWVLQCIPVLMVFTEAIQKPAPTPIKL